MTTPTAAALYEAEHLHSVRDKGTAVFNPKNLPLDQLPAIYGFNNGGSPGWFSAILLAEDGKALGGHICSSEAYMPHDLGILEGSRPDRHEEFKRHYPDGYRMVFIPSKEITGHQGLEQAIQLHRQQ